MSKWLVWVSMFVIPLVLLLVFGMLHFLHGAIWPLTDRKPNPVVVMQGKTLPSSPTIRYIGRWDKHDPTTYISYWGGAYFKTGFTGRHAQIRLASSASLYVSVDGEPDLHIDAGQGLSSLLPAPLIDGNHTLRVAAGSEETTIAFQGLLLDHDAYSFAPQSSPVTVEFVGDSITAGLTDTLGDLSSYAWLTAEALKVEHVQIASTGICLQATLTPLCLGMQTQFFDMQPANEGYTPWSYTPEDQPRAIVINLGTNDLLHGVSDSSFEVAYIDFVRKIFQRCPGTSIYVMRTFSGLMEKPTQNVVALLHAAGYEHVFYVDTTGWLVPDTSDFNDGLHPSDNGQRKVALRLASILQAVVRII